MGEHFDAAPGNEHIRVRRIEINSEGKHVDLDIDMDTIEIAIEYWN